VQRGVTEAELRRAKAQLKASVLMALESTSARCEQLAHQIATWGRVLPTEETVARIEAVTPGQTAAVARRMFRARPTLAAIGPLGTLPPIGAIAERIAA
jgi:predicted Zn-dependent peptidase